MDRTLLTQQDREDAVAGLDGWSVAPDGRSISRDFLFSDFSEAFGFMARAALKAERMDHHPDWSNVYNRVHVKLNTHDAGGITALDIALAEKMNQLA